MKIVALTSSRADYGIFRPLLRRLEADPFFDLHIVAFGTHLSTFHGYTYQQIEDDNYSHIICVENMVLGDSEEAVSTAMGLTTQKFAGLWSSHKESTDLIICLGDRYEMFAATSAALPFNIPIAHIHGGETSLGAIDNVFRHSLSLMSTYHFVSTQPYADKVASLTDSSEHIWNVGALSLDNISELNLLSKSEFWDTYNIDLNLPSILCTFHPETRKGEANHAYIEELCEAFEALTDYQIVITMPNADPLGNMIRSRLNQLIESQDHVIGVENFGTLGYFSIMRHCSLLVGNTSSGIIEAASFKKFVINLGDRQKGRAVSDNVIHVELDKSSILHAIHTIAKKGDYQEENIYWQGGATDKIIGALKTIYAHVYN